MAESKTTKKAGVQVKKVVVKEPKEVSFATSKAISEPQVAEKRKILFVASEARPFIATGGLADVIGSLPQALAQDPAYDFAFILGH